MDVDMPVHPIPPPNERGISKVVHLYNSLHKRKRENRPAVQVEEQRKSILQTEKEPTRKEVIEYLEDIQAQEQNQERIRVKKPKQPRKRPRKS